MDDRQFRQLLDYFQYSWAGYRKVRKGVKKRISRHMYELKCPNVNDYLDLIRHNDQERHECERRMTVSISRFFRDRKLWLDLEKKILPQLLAGQKEILKVWSAGCARGEEVYSFMIIWDRLKTQLNHLTKLEVTASDMHSEYIEKAQIGIFSKSSLKEATDEIRDNYFEKTKGGNRYGVKALLKENITWQVRNIVSDPPHTGFHIIFLRNNLLTYYRYHLIKKPLSKILTSLNPGGCLIVGSHEKLPDDESSGFTRNSATPWVYRKDISIARN